VVGQCKTSAKVIVKSVATSTLLLRNHSALRRESSGARNIGDRAKVGVIPEEDDA